MAFCDPWSWWGTHNNLDWSARSCAPMGDCVSDIGVFEGLFDVHKAFDHCRNPDHLRLKYFGAERASELVQPPVTANPPAKSDKSGDKQQY